MIPQLPEPIATYFAVSNGADDARLDECFAPEATVHDEHHTHRGIPAIRAWLAEARRQYACHVEPLGLQTDGGRTLVVGKVTGTFPGSPVALTHAFDIAGARIRSLEIS